MPYNNTRRQTFCILVMITAIFVWGGNNKSHTKAIGTREGVGSNYNESHTKALGAREGVGSNYNGSHTKALGARQGVGSNYSESHTKALGVGSNYSESHTKALGAKERVGANYKGSHSKALGAREGEESNDIEQQFLQWVKFVGKLKKHSLFGVAQNVFNFKSTLVVDKSPGKGDFKSIQQAVNSVPNFNLFRVVIQINQGIYTEKVSIPWSKPYITFQGAGSNNTIIQWNDTADKIIGGGRALGTFNTATVAIDAPYFIATNLTFKNYAPLPSVGEKNKQASAVRVSGDASAFVGCQFLGAQDTLYDHKGRHFFQDCYIEGSVDFIFGDGLSMYKNCHLHAIGARYESITAQNRASPLEDSGFSFLKCKVTGSGPLYLGRAWGSFSRVVYAYTYMDSIVIPKGWYNWGDPKREGTVYYGQYKCSGPGASAQGRVIWSRELSDEEAQPFLDLTFVDGSEWIGL